MPSARHEARIAPGPHAPDQMTVTGNRERGVLAAVFYGAGAAVVALAVLASGSAQAWLLVLAGLAAGVAGLALLARDRFVYGATVLTSVLGPVLIALAVVAGRGGVGSALTAGLYTFVAVHTALVLRTSHTAGVMTWAGVTALVANQVLDGPVPAMLVAVVFVLLCGTLSGMTLWLVGEVRRQATTDPLTGVANRSSFASALEHAYATVARTGEPLSLVALDLDGFKQINDRHGHAAGDRTLVAVATAWQAQLRDRDVLARMGGDEFCVILPGSDGSQARKVAARLEESMPDGTACSTGVATLADVDGLEELSVAADRELYAAKARKWRAAALRPTTEPVR